MRTKRGSAMLFVVVMVGLMTVGILSAVQLTTSAAELQSKREAQARGRSAFDGAIQVCLTECRAKTVTIPCTKKYVVGDLEVELTATNNGSVVSRTIKMDAKVKVQGRTLRYTRTVGNSLDPHPFYYALFTNSQLDPLKSLTFGSGGANGDVNLNGGVVLRANPFTVNGDFETTTSTLPMGASISGNLLRQASSVPFPSFNKGNYNPGLIGGLVNSATFLLGSLAGLVFPAIEPYQLVYKGSDLSISGAFSGKGTIFVDGNVTISGNMSYSSADSRLVVIATGKITIAAGVTNYVGLFYTPTEFVSNATATTLDPGAIATQKLTVAGPMTIVHDPGIWNDPELGVKHRIPGMWP